jgi:hypothetical protein
MSAIATRPMGSSASWRNLIRQKRQKAKYRITLEVRGKQIVKEYTTEDEYRKWKETYLLQQERGGVSNVHCEVLYSSAASNGG